jgi:hypothetical protein
LRDLDFNDLSVMDSGYLLSIGVLQNIIGERNYEDNP